MYYFRFSASENRFSLFAEPALTPLGRDGAGQEVGAVSPASSFRETLMNAIDFDFRVE
jgi:hypothetical protein